MAPKVSIGIPIYYGEIYLEDTLQSILKQPFTDYEIIITDNNPGGKPKEIAEAYANQYPNIHYFIHQKNIGALQNWNSTIRKAQGKYYICAGAHDLWSDNLLGSLVEILDNNKDVVIAYPPSILMDANGRSLNKPTSYVNTTGLGITARFNLIFWCGEDSLYGLIRMEAINKTRLQLEVIGSGAIWLGELVVQGHFQVCPGEVRYRRINRKESSREQRLERYHKTLFGKKRFRLFPHLRMLWGYITSVVIMHIPFAKKIKLLITTTVNFIIYFGHAIFYYDIISFIKRLFGTKVIKN